MTTEQPRVDPDSDTGRRVADELAELFLDVEERIAREKQQAATRPRAS